MDPIMHEQLESSLLEILAIVSNCVKDKSQHLEVKDKSHHLEDQHT